MEWPIALAPSPTAMLNWEDVVLLPTPVEVESTFVPSPSWTAAAYAWLDEMIVKAMAAASLDLTIVIFCIAYIYGFVKLTAM
jgi:hypothetical protein